MRKLIYLVLLVCILSPIYGQQETELPVLLVSLRSEIGFLQSCLVSINDELNQTKLFMKSLLLKNEAEQTILQIRIEYLETESSRLDAEKNKLEVDYKELNESGDLSTKLRQAFNDYRTSAETAIKIPIMRIQCQSFILSVLGYQMEIFHFFPRSAF